MFFKIGVLKNFAIYTRKHLCWSLLFNKVAGLRPAILIKKRLQHKRFLANIGKSFYRVTPVAASKTRQFLLYLCYVLFSKPFRVLFFLRQKYIIFKILPCHKRYSLWDVSMLKCLSSLAKFLKRHYIIEKQIRLNKSLLIHSVFIYFTWDMRTWGLLIWNSMKGFNLSHV